MVKNKNGTAMSISGGVALSGLTALGLTVISSMILGKLIEQGRLPMERTGYVLMGVLVTVSFTSALIGAGKVKHRRTLVCGACGVVYFGLLLCITALFFDGQYGAVWETALMILLGSGGAAIAGCVGRRNGRIRKKKS